MNKTLKTILIYLIPLIIGIGFAITIHKLESFGRKNTFKSYVHLWTKVGPDSLTNHFPEIDFLNDAIFSTIASQDKKEIGGGYVKVTIEKSDSLDQFIETLKIKERLKDIKKDQIFNADLNYRERKYEINNYTNNSLYPFPDFINAKNFDNYKIVFYDFGKGKYIKDNRIKENNHLDSNWKHGFTRGIVENQENEYEMWLIIW